MKSINSKLLVLLILLLGISISPVYAIDEIYTGFLSKNAVGGYDSVAYFTEGRPVEGESKFATTYKGTKWLFSSQKNLDLFKANPDKYAPQYGGYCAWAVSQGYTAKGDPQHWEIFEGRLYLNFNASIQERWSGNKAELVSKADRLWPGLLNQ